MDNSFTAKDIKLNFNVNDALLIVENIFATMKKDPEIMKLLNMPKKDLKPKEYEKLLDKNHLKVMNKLKLNPIFKKFSENHRFRSLFFKITRCNNIEEEKLILNKLKIMFAQINKMKKMSNENLVESHKLLSSKWAYEEAKGTFPKELMSQVKEYYKKQNISIDSDSDNEKEIKTKKK